MPAGAMFRQLAEPRGEVAKFLSVGEKIFVTKYEAKSLLAETFLLERLISALFRRDFLRKP